MGDKGFIDLIKLAYVEMVSAAPPTTSALELWLDYKRQVKRMAVSWGTARSADRRREVKEIQHQLNDPNLPAASRKALRANLACINAKAQSDRAIRSSASYQAEGDRPSASFFAKVGKSSAYSSIQALTLQSGVVSTDMGEIGEDMANFWGGVFGEGLDFSNTPAEVRQARIKSLQRITQTLTQQQAQEMGRQISQQELEEVVKNAKNGKSPGADGLPIEFYRVCWDFLGPILT